jgi:hypothetical protein
MIRNIFPTLLDRLAVLLGRQPARGAWGPDVVEAKLASVPAPVETPGDGGLVRRIASSYAFAVRGAERDVPGVWQHIFNLKLRDADRILGSGESERISTLLRDPAASDLFWGIDDLVLEYQHALLRPEAREKHRMHCAAVLLRLGEAFGSVKLFNPEASAQRPPKVTPDGVLAACEAALGARLGLPNIFRNEIGLQTSRGVLSYRMLHALYLGLRMRSLLGDLRGKRILEIGAGVGRSAYFGAALGAASYDVVDIPITGAIQAYFLGRTLGDDAVRMQGEAERAGACVRLLTPAEFLDAAERYDLIVNVDSLTEIPREHAQRYAAVIPARCPMFLSINHEVNEFVVAELFAGCAHLRTRHAYWLRPGYAEELYRWDKA